MLPSVAKTDPFRESTKRLTRSTSDALYEGVFAESSGNLSLNI
jgi:hypothetical protein